MAEDDNELKRRYMRWSGELQEAYLEALEECGGLNEARPKALLDLLLPRFPFLTLQESLGPANVKNHLQKQRTKEFKGGASGMPSGANLGLSAYGMPGSVFDSQGDPMMNDSPDSGLTDGTDPTGAADVPGGEAGVNSEQCPQEPAAPARNVPTLWLPDSWAQPLCGNAGVQPSSLIELAKRALALTVHQLALYRKLLEELELHEADHSMLVAALREDPTGQSLVLDAQRSAAGASGFAAATMAASGSGGSGSSEEARPARLRRLLARLLPPNPFSSGAKAQAAMKLAAWIAAVARDSEAGAFSIGSPMVGAGDLPPGTLPNGSRQAVGAAADGQGTDPAGSLLAGSAASGLSAGQQQELLAAAAAAGRLGALGDDDTEDEDEDEMPDVAAERPQQKERRPHRQQRKRHKPLSELLAGIPLLPPADRLAAAAAAQQQQPPQQQQQPMMPTAAQLQQVLGGAGALGLGAPEVLQGLGGMGAAAPGTGAFGPDISLLLQPQLQQQGQQAQGQGQHGAQLEQQMLNEDALMLRALDAQMSSLLLQSVSNALMRTSQEGGAPPLDAVDAAGAASSGQAPLLGSFEEMAAAVAAGQMALPPSFQAAAAAGLGEEMLLAGALDISVLRSFLDMLSSGGLSPLTSGGFPTLPDIQMQPQGPPEVVPAAQGNPPSGEASMAASAGRPPAGSLGAGVSSVSPPTGSGGTN